MTFHFPSKTNALYPLAFAFSSYFFCLRVFSSPQRWTLRETRPDSASPPACVSPLDEQGESAHNAYHYRGCLTRPDPEQGQQLKSERKYRALVIHSGSYMLVALINDYKEELKRLKIGRLV